MTQTPPTIEQKVKLTLLLLAGLASFPIHAQVNPAITAPITGSILNSEKTLVSWEPNRFDGEVIQYQIRAGSTPGGSQYYIRTQGTNQPRTINGLPSDGSKVYIQLRYKTMDGWTINPAIEFTTSETTYPEITSPTPGSTLTAGKTVVSWEPNDLASDIVQYQVRAGSTPGGSDYYIRTQGTNNSRTLTGLPNDGSTVFFQLRYKTLQGWKVNQAFSTTASNITHPAITTPSAGSTLSAGTTTISWEPNDLAEKIVQYQIRAGSTPGSSDLYIRTQGTNRSRTITGLPTDGSPVYFQLRYKTEDGWNTNPAIVVSTVYDPNHPSIITPTPGSVLSESNRVVSWLPNDFADEIVQYQIRAGSTPGGTDYYIRTQGTNQSRTLTGLPTDGSNVYIQLRYKTQDGWTVTPPIAYTAVLQSETCPSILNSDQNLKIPNIAKPTYAEYFLDPTFSSKIMRISDSQLGEVNKPLGSTIQAWNADESLIILYNAENSSESHMLYDGITYEPIMALDIIPSNIEEIFWSHTDPDEFFYISGRPESHGELRRFSINEGESSYVTDFNQFCRETNLPDTGSKVHMQSLDDDLFGFRCNNEDGGHVVLSYRVSTDVTHSKLIIDDPTEMVNDAPSPAASGDRFWFQGTVLNTDLTEVQSFNSTHSGNNSDKGLTNEGQDALYQLTLNASPINCSANTGAIDVYLAEYNLEDGSCRPITKQTTDYSENISATYISAQAYKQVGKILISSKWKASKIAEYTSGENEAPALFSEIYLTDYSTDKPTTCRLAHHRSLGSFATNANYPSNLGEPHATISPSGTRILFASDWYGSGSVDSYVIELPNYNP